MTNVAGSNNETFHSSQWDQEPHRPGQSAQVLVTASPEWTRLPCVNARVVGGQREVSLLAGPRQSANLPSMPRSHAPGISRTTDDPIARDSDTSTLHLRAVISLRGLYRQGSALESFRDLGVASTEGFFALPHHAGDDWGTNGQHPNGAPVVAWTAYNFPVRLEWRSGVYIAILTELDPDGTPISASDTTTADARAAPVGNWLAFDSPLEFS
jgi:hypothetical protein